jgi:hypothetical protein
MRPVRCSTSGPPSIRSCLQALILSALNSDLRHWAAMASTDASTGPQPSVLKRWLPRVAHVLRDVALDGSLAELRHSLQARVAQAVQRAWTSAQDPALLDLGSQYAELCQHRKNGRLWAVYPQGLPGSTCSALQGIAGDEFGLTATVVGWLEAVGQLPRPTLPPPDLAAVLGLAESREDVEAAALLLRIAGCSEGDMPTDTDVVPMARLRPEWPRPAVAAAAHALTHAGAVREAVRFAELPELLEAQPQIAALLPAVLRMLESDACTASGSESLNKHGVRTGDNMAAQLAVAAMEALVLWDQCPDMARLDALAAADASQLVVACANASQVSPTLL